MQHMPDKDFDKLFKDSFMDAEIEPSADLWGNIAQQLEPQKKRSFPLFWMAAASVAVVASVMLFTKGGDKVYLQGAAPEVAVVNNAETQALPVVDTQEETTVAEAILPERTATSMTLLKREITKPVAGKIEDTQKNNLVAVQPSDMNEHLPIKRGDAKPLDVAPVVNIPVDNKVSYANVPDAKPIDYFEQQEESDSNKKGIRNVGDLINYVVDKVDKRDKKLIKFDTDDDDNSSIIGLNIGFLKLNKKNNK